MKNRPPMNQQKLLRRYMLVNWKVEHARKEGYVEWMTPREYIERSGGDENAPGMGTYYDVEEEKSLPVSELARKMKEGKEIPVPFVYGSGRESQQEGRHRAKAAEIVGERVIPVRVNNPYAMYSKELANEFIVRAGFGLRDVGGTGEVSSDKPYANEWRRRFEGGHPEVYMDEERRRIYNQILQERGLTKRDVYGNGFVAKDVEGGERVNL